MKCLDCKDIEMGIDFIDETEARDVFEVVWICPKCKSIFFASIYRSEVKHGNP